MYGPVSVRGPVHVWTSIGSTRERDSSLTSRGRSRLWLSIHQFSTLLPLRSVLSNAAADPKWSIRQSDCHETDPHLIRIGIQAVPNQLSDSRQRLLNIGNRLEAVGFYLNSDVLHGEPFILPVSD